MAEEKKGLFVRLFGGQAKSGGCCGNVRIEEIAEEEAKAPQQVRSVGRRGSCCGPAPDARDTSAGSK